MSYDLDIDAGCGYGLLECQGNVLLNSDVGSVQNDVDAVSITRRREIFLRLGDVLLDDGLLVPVILVVEANRVIVGRPATSELHCFYDEVAVHGVLHSLSHILVGKNRVGETLELRPFIFALQMRVADVHVNYDNISRGRLRHPDVGIAGERTQLGYRGCYNHINRAGLESLYARNRLWHVKEDNLVGVGLAFAPVVRILVEYGALSGVVLSKSERSRAVLCIG